MLRKGRDRGHIRRVMYRPGESLLHRLHPLAKLAWLVGGTVLVFVIPTPWAVLGMLALIAAAFALGRVTLRDLPGLRLFGFMALMLLVLQLTFVRTGAVLLEVGPLRVTADGLAAGVYVAGRLLSVILLSYLFVLTTEPNDLAYALMQVGLPYRYGFTLITAIRLVPLFEQEGQTVYQAQLARGIAYDAGGPRRFLTLARQFFLPLLVSALGKVNALAVSMEGRCFGKYPRRTYLREVRFHGRDGVAVAVWVGVGVLLAVAS